MQAADFTTTTTTTPTSSAKCVNRLISTNMNLKKDINQFTATVCRWKDVDAEKKQITSGQESLRPSFKEAHTTLTEPQGLKSHQDDSLVGLSRTEERDITPPMDLI
ncbi:hypothetical protein EYF80_033298 [Liparis tanakae]|uniref:Uncharacterized protein n=1 Tax=Liparis tanakae TaxID=230148 RepID=A0A4Z2GT67_9TELE|nr:hypothetical protein EYF80_033298 [Liparis tanakae]